MRFKNSREAGFEGYIRITISGVIYGPVNPKTKKKEIIGYDFPAYSTNIGRVKYALKNKSLVIQFINAYGKGIPVAYIYTGVSERNFLQFCKTRHFTKDHIVKTFGAGGKIG
jgi:hypothetical protein